MNACIAYEEGMLPQATQLAKSLAAKGVSPCLVPLGQLSAEVVEPKDIAPAHRDCILNADVFYVVVKQGDVSPQCEVLLNICVTLGKKLVAVVDGDIPPKLDELADEVFVPNSVGAAEAATSDQAKSDHPSRNGVERAIKRVKCQ